jgi:two-component system sensor histidine kinase KdpD
MQKVTRGALRIIGSVAIVAALTSLFYRLLPVNSTTVALVFVLAILAIATRWGLTEAIVSSVLAMLCFNFFFLPPVGTLTIADPQNWVALLTFLITAVVASQLSASVRRRELEASSRRNEVEKLYELSRAMMLTTESKLASELPMHLARIFNAEGVAFYDRSTGDVYRAGAREVPLTDAKLKDIALQGTTVQDGGAGLITLPVALGGHNIGALSVLGCDISEAAVHALGNLIAIALEREHAHELAAVADAARQNEHLKSVLLDAVAHEFKTPLTSIKAAATALLSNETHDGSENELLTIVDEEADRLTQLVDEAIQMARIEAGQLKLTPQPVDMSQLVACVLKDEKIMARERTLRTEIDAVPPVYADAEQIQLVLRQILDNAFKYSPVGSQVTLGVHMENGEAVVSVADQGPGIPEYDMPQIFDRFYRGRQIRDRIPGTGMGLAIVREIVQAHGGRIWARNLPTRGAEFSFTLPLADATAAS